MAGQSVESLLVHVRDEQMVSSLLPKTTVLRPGHFLIPIHNSIDGSASDLPPKPVTEKARMGFNFCRLKTPVKEWNEWVDIMRSKHQTSWKEVGIFDAIINSKCTIYRDDELLHDFAERWCSETNTFVFPWGEATLTLEDMLMLGGYSILGNLVNSPLKPKQKKIEEKLELERCEFLKSKSKKACHGAWLKKFMNRGNENEHEAFLVYWLSRYVFPLAEGSIVKSLIPIAVHLAKGTKIALAPAVLANIYSDLNAYKKSGLSYTYRLKNVLVSSQFNLIQVWVWERFPLLQPEPKISSFSATTQDCNPEEPSFIKWHESRRTNGGTVKEVTEEAIESFVWRPYTKSGGIYEKEVETVIKCLRVSLIGGIETDKCIERYLPHRVAMQFALDQDIPAVIERSMLALKEYERPIDDKGFNIPCRLFQPNVTVRYLEWWEKPESTQDVDFEALSNKKQKLMDSGTRCSAPNEKASTDKIVLDSCENKSNPFSRSFDNSVHYKKIMKQMALKSPEKKPSCNGSKDGDFQPDEAAVTYLPLISSEENCQYDKVVVTYTPEILSDEDCQSDDEPVITYIPEILSDDDEPVVTYIPEILSDDDEPVVTYLPEILSDEDSRSDEKKL